MTQDPDNGDAPYTEEEMEAALTRAKTDPTIFSQRITRANHRADAAFNLGHRVNRRVSGLVSRVATIQDDYLPLGDCNHHLAHDATDKAVKELQNMVAALIEQAGLKLPEDPLTLEGEDCEHSYWPNGTICIWCGDQKVREEPYPGHPDVEFTPGRVEGVAGWTGGIKPSEKIVVPKPELCPVCLNEMWVRANRIWCTHCHPSRIVTYGPDPNARYVHADGKYFDPHSGEGRKFVVGVDERFYCPTKNRRVSSDTCTDCDLLDACGYADSGHKCPDPATSEPCIGPECHAWDPIDRCTYELPTEEPPVGDVVQEFTGDDIGFGMSDGDDTPASEPPTDEPCVICTPGGDKECTDCPEHPDDPIEFGKPPEEPDGSQCETCGEYSDACACVCAIEERESPAEEPSCDTCGHMIVTEQTVGPPGMTFTETLGECDSSNQAVEDGAYYEDDIKGKDCPGWEQKLPPKEEELDKPKVAPYEEPPEESKKEGE